MLCGLPHSFYGWELAQCQLVCGAVGARWGGSHCPHPPKDPFLGGHTQHGAPAQVGGGRMRAPGSLGSSRGGLWEDWVSRLKAEGGGQGHGQRGSSAKAQRPGTGGTRMSQKSVVLPRFLSAMAAASPCAQHFGRCFSVSIHLSLCGGHGSRVMCLPPVSVGRPGLRLSAWSPAPTTCARTERACSAPVSRLFAGAVSFDRICWKRKLRIRA